MKPLLLQSTAPAESPWVRSEGCKGIRFDGATEEDWFKIFMHGDGTSANLTVNGAQKKYLFNGLVPIKVKVTYVQGIGPVDVDLI